MDNLLVYWVWLTTLFEFSSCRIAKVYYKLTPKEAYLASYEELVGAGVDAEDAQLLQNKSLDRARKIIEDCERLSVKIVAANSALYPRSLERLKEKPYVLYVKGDISCLKKKTAALVGTRRMTKKGREASVEIARNLIDEGYTLISGGADGIDSVGAEVSLEANAPFCIVSAVDIDKYYPASNKSLINKVAEKGVVISEYPPKANARYFPTRNRIIAALSDEVYVGEAPEGSGALITARDAKSLGIKVHAYIDEGTTFLGCRQLVKEGAIPMGKVKEKVKRKKKAPELSGTKLYIYQQLEKGSASDNDLVDGEHPIVDILIALTELELDGIITALPGNKYKLS